MGARVSSRAIPAVVTAAAFTACVAQAQSSPVTPANLMTLAGRILQFQSLCGWIGVQVSPMTLAFADSLGMAVIYGAIFDQPEPGGPAADGGIEAGDVGPPTLRSDHLAAVSRAPHRVSP
jgi:hypothetical protein